VPGRPAAPPPVPPAQFGRVREYGQFRLGLRPGDLAALVGGPGQSVTGGGQLGREGAAAAVEHPGDQGKEDGSPQQEAGPEEDPSHPVAPVTRSGYRRRKDPGQCATARP